MVEFIALISAALIATLLCLDLLFGRPDDTRLEATVSAAKPHKLQIHIGADAFRTHVYPDFEAEHHAAIPSGRYHIPHTRETGDATLSSAYPKVSRGSFEVKATLNLKPEDRWNLKAGDQIAVEVEIFGIGWQWRPRGKKTVPRYAVDAIETGYVYITVS